MTRHNTIFDKENSALVVVDIQEKLWPHVCDPEGVQANCVKAIEVAKRLQLPILATEQYPKGLGQTIPPVRAALEGFEVIEKVAFGCFGSEEFSARISDMNLARIAVVGIETHICVVQTVLDGLARDLQVHLLADCVSSRNEDHSRTAIDRMAQAGAIISNLESFTYELLGKAGTPEFKSVLPLFR